MFKALLKSSQQQHLSKYKQQEILNYSLVYYIGADSTKKPAHLDQSTNNYGYNDDRGDYHVIDQDHLGYCYEVMDSLVFGQVLSC